MDFGRLVVDTTLWGKMEVTPGFSLTADNYVVSQFLTEAQVFAFVPIFVTTYKRLFKITFTLLKTFPRQNIKIFS